MFSERLKNLRKNKKLTQEYMANLLGITRQGYGKYEKSEAQPDFTTLEKLANFFGVTTDYLLGREENKVKVGDQDIILTTDEYKVFEELKKHPVLFHDLASDPEKKVKELIKLYKMKKMFLEDDDEENGNGFGELGD